MTVSRRVNSKPLCVLIALSIHQSLLSRCQPLALNKRRVLANSPWAASVIQCDLGVISKAIFETYASGIIFPRVTGFML